jgi:hypothetical protein
MITFILAFVGTLLIALIPIVFAAVGLFRHPAANTAIRRRLLLLLFAGIALQLCLLPMSFTFGFPFSPSRIAVAVLSPIYEFGGVVLAAGTGVWILWLLLPPFRNQIEHAKTADRELRKKIAEIFDSELYLTSFRTTIPTSVENVKNGFELIPSILSLLDERRKRFERSSARFLRVTIALGLVLCAIVMYFGYILVNEATAGTPRLLVQVESQLTNVQRDLVNQQSRLTDNPVFMNTVGADIDALEVSARKVPPSRVPLAGRLMHRVRGSIDSNNTDSVRLALFNADTTYGNASRASGVALARDEEFLIGLRRAEQHLSEFVAVQTKSIGNLQGAAVELRQLLPSLRAAIEKPQSRIPELIQRIALGLIVATFFLAILRYSARIYEKHYREMLLSEADDLLVRRYYIGLKSAGANEVQRDHVIQAFMTGAKPSLDQEDVPVPNSKESIDALKPIIDALAKRI